MGGGDEAGFAGFPDGSLRATVLPSLFFTEVLGPIDDLAELKVTLYLFWRLGQKKQYPRYLTRRALEADPTVARGLAGASGGLARGLERVVARGVALRRVIEFGDTMEECYFLNTASGRRAVRDLESGALDLGQIVRPEEPSRRIERPNIFHLYEQNVGLLTPLIAEQLAEAERSYPRDWIEDAVRQAVAYNRRNWRYIERILQRWATEGRGDEASGRSSR